MARRRDGAPHCATALKAEKSIDATLMNSTQEEAKEVFTQALNHADVAERNAFVERACGTRAALRQEVDSLLRAHEQAGEFLGRTLHQG